MTHSARHPEWFEQVIIAAGGYTAEKASKLIEAGLIDAVVFGRDYIANPTSPSESKWEQNSMSNALLFLGASRRLYRLSVYE